MMKAKMKKKGVASLEELRALCLEADVKFIACQMTVDLFDFQTDRLHRRHRIRRRRDLHEVRRRDRRLPVHLTAGPRHVALLKPARNRRERRRPIRRPRGLGRLRARLRLRRGRQQDQLLHHGRAVGRRQHGPLGPHAHVAAGASPWPWSAPTCCAYTGQVDLREVGLPAADAALAVAAGRRRAVRRRHDAGRRLRQQEPDPPGRRQPALAGGAGLRGHLGLHDAQGPVRPVARDAGSTRWPSTCGLRLGQDQSLAVAAGPGQRAGRQAAPARRGGRRWCCGAAAASCSSDRALSRQRGAGLRRRACSACWSSPAGT